MFLSHCCFVIAILPHQFLTATFIDRLVEHSISPARTSGQHPARTTPSAAGWTCRAAPEPLSVVLLAAISCASAALCSTSFAMRKGVSVEQPAGRWAEITLTTRAGRFSHDTSVPKAPTPAGTAPVAKAPRPDFQVDLDPDSATSRPEECKSRLKHVQTVDSRYGEAPPRVAR